MCILVFLTFILNFTRSTEKDVMNSTENILYSIFIGIAVATFLLNTGRGVKTIELCKECLVLVNIKEIEEQYVKLLSKVIYGIMFDAYCRIPDYTNAIKYGRELLMVFSELGEKVIEGKFTMILANIYKHLYKYAESKELYGKAICISIQNGDKTGEANAYRKFGILSYCVREYGKAQEYIEKSIAIRMEIGDREGQAADYGNLANVFQSLGEYGKAQKYIQKALAIIMEIGDRKGEATCYGNLGTVFQSLGEYAKAQEYIEKALPIRMEIGDRKREAADYGNLGTVFESLGEYAKAQEYIEKAPAIRMEIGDREGEAAD